MSYTPEQIQAEMQRRVLMNGGQQQPPMQPPQTPVQPVESQLPYTPIFSGQGLKELGAGVVSGVRNLANIPHNLSGGALPGAFQNTDFYEKFGVKKGIPGTIAEGLTEFSPFAKGAKLATTGSNLISKGLAGIGGSPLLKENILSGVAYGAAMPGEKSSVRGGVEGGLIGAGTHGLGKVTDELLVKPFARSLSKGALPQVVKNAEESIGKMRSPTEYASHLGESHKIAKEINTKNWEQTQSLAKNLDDFMGKNKGSIVNPKPYTSYLDNFIESKKALEPARKHPYSNAIKFAEELKELAPQSFSGMVDLRQTINQKLKSFMEKNNITKSDKNMDELLSAAKSKISDIIPAKFIKNEIAPKLQEFKERWSIANMSHQDLQEYYKAVKNSAGDIARLRTLRESLNSGKPLDASVFHKYMPRPQQEGVSGLEQLSKVMGSSQAKNAIRSYLGRDVGKSKDILASYSKLSPRQAEAIFGGTKEGTMLGLGKEIAKKFPDGAGWKRLGHGALSLGIPGAIGAGGLLLTGHSWDEALEGGVGTALAAHGIKKAGGKYLGNRPEKLRKMIDKGEKGRKNAGVGSNYAAQAYLGSTRNKKDEDNE